MNDVDYNNLRDENMEALKSLSAKRIASWILQTLSLFSAAILQVLRLAGTEENTELSLSEQSKLSVKKIACVIGQVSHLDFPHGLC